MFKFFYSSFPNILLWTFIVYIIYSLWSMVQLFVPPTCPKVKQCIVPLLEETPVFQLVVFASPKTSPRSNNDVTLLYNQKIFNYNEDWEKIVIFNLPKNLHSNGSLQLHLFLTSRTINEPNWQSVVKEPYSVYATVPFTKYQIPESKYFNLLGKSGKKTKDSKSSSYKPVSHISTVIPFNILTQNVLLPRDGIPYEIGRSLRLSPNGKYLPILHIDTLNMRLKNLLEVTPDLTSTNITFVYSPITYGKLRLWVQLEDSMRTMLNLGFTEKDIEEVKGIFSDSHLYLLLVTFLVASLHLLFDFLAFKNDITFWRDLDTMGGISSSTVLWRAFAQTIIFLYLMEENTSLLVLIPAGVGVLIEGWKVTKAFHVKLVGWRPVLTHKSTKEEDQTNKLDQEGLKYLSFLMVPICLGGAVYSLFYVPHKSWYSWFINSLVNGIYGFGFLFMLPQLFINYKLKSVAHLPWRSFMYKAFNTFIDDLFAFIITMPTAHRVACFRDDIVFLIYLYQRWLYPVDKTRMNEFGQSGEDKKKKE